MHIYIYSIYKYIYNIKYVCVCIYVYIYTYFLRQSLIHSPTLECSGMNMAQCSLNLLGSSDPST